MSGGRAIADRFLAEGILRFDDRCPSAIEKTARSLAAKARREGTDAFRDEGYRMHRIRGSRAVAFERGSAVRVSFYASVYSAPYRQPLRPYIVRFAVDRIELSVMPEEVSAFARWLPRLYDERATEPPYPVDWWSREYGWSKTAHRVISAWQAVDRYRRGAPCGHADCAEHPGLAEACAKASKPG